MRELSVQDHERLVRALLATRSQMAWQMQLINGVGIETILYMALRNQREGAQRRMCPRFLNKRSKLRTSASL